MKIDIVKPMPHSTDTAKICLKLIPSGSFATPSLTAAQLKLKMPSGLPRNRPSATPSGSIEVSPANDTPCSEIPALAKANTGKIAKAT
ncbi:Uncharacterised protein [Vibrio cholerae]|nr:Uncharacterised protein [Vibrio cholerae]CSB08546.1 Uncharacterised protein [Vibrio cholerae]CSC47138.1 Uncharacterised protein [Vibrio cholerae]CSI69470.1 Uncharacterised protein [Vibrio cholerae]